MSEVCLIKSNEIVDGSTLMWLNFNLKSWDSDLSLLSTGYYMFADCYNATDFRADTPYLENGFGMFYNFGINNSTPSSIEINLSNLENGEQMFTNSSVLLKSKESIHSGWVLPKLKCGRRMFEKCSGLVQQCGTNGTSDFGYLCFPSLEDGSLMFYRCSAISYVGEECGFNHTSDFSWMFAVSNITGFSHNHLVSPNSGGIYPSYVNMSSMFASSSLSTCNIGLGVDEILSDIKIDCTSMFNATNNLIRFEFLPSFGKFLYNADNMFNSSSIINFVENGRESEYYVIAALPNCYTANSMFANCPNLTDVKDLCLYNVRLTRSMFEGCSNLQRVAHLYLHSASGCEFRNCGSLVIAKLEIGTGTFEFSETFAQCKKLQYVYLLPGGGLDNTPEGTNLMTSCYGMFANCKNLELITENNTVKKFDFKYVNNAEKMFINCYKVNTDCVKVFTNTMTGLVYGDEMFYQCTSLDALPFTYLLLGNLVSANYMFSGCNAMVGDFEDFCESGSGMWSLTYATNMFENCSQMSGNWNLYLPELVDGDFMFAFTGLSAFVSAGQTHSMPKLVNGKSMFNYTLLSSFNTETPLMADGTNMFYGCEQLTNFQGNLDSLTHANEMFVSCHLQSFDTALPSLAYGCGMFRYCSSLNNFDVELPSLQDGDGMFEGCNLTGDSVRRILNTIPQYTNGNHTLTLGMCDDGCDVFGEITGFEGTITNIPTLAITYKGWNIEVTTNTEGGYEVTQPSPLSIVEGSQYIPDASTWNDAFTSSGIVVTSVHDGYAWNDNLS